MTNSDKVATHIENRLRAENNLSLRTHYGFYPSSGENIGEILNLKTRSSIYFNENGTTNFKPLKKEQKAFMYFGGIH